MYFIKNTCIRVHNMVDFVYKENYAFEDLVKLVEILRLYCPWDREQTHQSIRRNLLEEAYEAAEAIDLEDPELLREELGDVLLQVVFHTQMEREKGRFDIGSVCTGVCRKLIERHPHIFGDVVAGSAPEVLERWDEIKRRQKGQATHTEAIQSVARSLPSLWRTDKTLEKAGKSGLLPDIDGGDRLERFKALLDDIVSINEGGSSKAGYGEYAIGELLLLVVELARSIQVDPERALEKACDRFVRRFSFVENRVAEDRTEGRSGNRDLADLWREAKSGET
mgnify:FL=1